MPTLKRQMEHKIRFTKEEMIEAVEYLARVKGIQLPEGEKSLWVYSGMNESNGEGELTIMSDV